MTEYIAALTPMPRPRVSTTTTANNGLRSSERIENRTPYESLAESLGFASGESARKTFYPVQAKLLARLKRRSDG